MFIPGSLCFQAIGFGFICGMVDIQYVYLELCHEILSV